MKDFTPSALAAEVQKHDDDMTNIMFSTDLRRAECDSPIVNTAAMEDLVQLLLTYQEFWDDIPDQLGIASINCQKTLKYKDIA